MRKAWKILLWPAWILSAFYALLCAAILIFILFGWGYDAWAQEQQQISIPPNAQKINRAYRFTGRWVPDESSVSAGADPTNLNYITLRNLRYTGAGTGTSLEGVLGYTKVNSTPITTYTNIRNGHQLFVNATDTASHVLVQGVSSNGSSAIYLSSAQIPNPGNFMSTAIHTDAAGAGLGRFSTGAGEVVAYSNGVENRVWGGNETRVSAFYMVTNSSGGNPKNYTEAAESTLDDAASCVPIGTQRFWIVLSTRALRGVKYTVKTANAAAATTTGKYWNGTSFVAVGSLVDGTSSGGASLAQSGWMTFTSTVGSAAPYHFEGKYLYAYLFEISAGSASVSHVTVDAPWQAIPDVWDGAYRTNRRFQVITAGIPKDYTLETQDESSTQYPIAALLGGINATDHVILMFKDRMAGIKLKFIAGSVNTRPATLTAYYHNGTAWTTPGAFVDGTKNGTCSLSQDGIMTWNPPSKAEEFEQTIYGTTGYAYKLEWNGTLGNSTSTDETSVGADVISGIPASNPPAVAKFSASYQGRLMLCNFESKGQANRIDFSYPNAPDIWNGEQSSDDGLYSLYFGAASEPIVAATEIFNRIGNSPNSMFVVLKKTSTYMTIGTDSASASRTMFTTYTVSNTVGCAAPLTLVTCEMGYDVAEGVQRNLSAWLTYSGPYTFDGMVLQPIPGVSSYFNPAESKCINFAAIENARAWYDSTYKEYNLLIPSGAGQTENNVWLVYDMTRKKWFEKSLMVTNLYPLSGFPVQDEYGSRYIYAGRNDG
ncbi:MAG: hypothetical protein M0R06_19605, partial [Sphaerochaeta sp.]|nr:hypothetical protein [Sphaerochaeta sp.]